MTDLGGNDAVITESIEIYSNIDIVDAAVKYHFSQFSKATNKLRFTSLKESSKSLKLYHLSYVDEEDGGTLIADFGKINIRKLSVSKTVLTINPGGAAKVGGFNGDILKQKLAEAKESYTNAIASIVAGLKNDGLLSIAEPERKDKSKDHLSKNVFAHTYVDLERLEELKSIKSSRSDLAKLIRLCEELNVCYVNDCYYAVPMLIRAILDHIPPIFGQPNFDAVKSQYGTQSFKKSMEHLHKSLRNIADSFLHTPIRNKESLPNRTQINFSADLDVLLAEIVRTLK